MPLHVRMSINNQIIDRIHIARMEALGDHEAYYKYSVVNTDLPHEFINYDEGVEFTHRYSDGAQVCVEKALRALREAP